MSLRPSEHLTESAVKKGLHLVILDGLATEAMVVFTAGSILTALALALGATNFQIGLLAAMPTFTNIFQLVTIWLVQGLIIAAPSPLFALPSPVRRSLLSASSPSYLPPAPACTRY